mmetsp:Transcript_9187/g.13937  ORF Transcript_9187/g.13937 Transcript_9187/m.13937 type:complete len:217 (-) Transcript_9187:230-880(-)
MDISCWDGAQVLVENHFLLGGQVHVLGFHCANTPIEVANNRRRPISLRRQLTRSRQRLLRMCSLIIILLSLGSLILATVRASWWLINLLLLPLLLGELLRWNLRIITACLVLLLRLLLRRLLLPLLLGELLRWNLRIVTAGLLLWVSLILPRLLYRLLTLPLRILLTLPLRVLLRVLLRILLRILLRMNWLSWLYWLSLLLLLLPACLGELLRRDL